MSKAPSPSSTPPPSARIAARRDYAGPVFLSQGFRPFFLGAAIWATLALALWLTEWLGLLPPLAFLSAAWHAHEMIFGFAGAAMSGFLLTAIPNWTGRLPVRGKVLAALALLWLAGRIAMLGAGFVGPVVAGIIDSAYLLVLALAVWREIMAGQNWRNAVVATAISLLAAANFAFHMLAARALDTAPAERAGIAVLAGLLMLIGGRIIPSFTRNTLARRGLRRLPAPTSRFDRITLIISVFALVFWVFLSQSLWCGALAALASGFNLARLGRWRTLAILDEPMLWALHLGYLWIGIGFGLLAAHVFGAAVPQSAAIHGFAAGAFGTMILAIMTRASRGHSGLTLSAGLAETGIYGAVTVAAILRLVASLTGQIVFYQLSGLFWVLAFGSFVVTYWKILTTRLRLRPPQ